MVLEDHADLAMDVATAFFNVRDTGSCAKKLKDLGSLRLLLGLSRGRAKMWA